MKSIRYVFCRGVFALGLMAVGVGSGIGLPPEADTADAPECHGETQVLIANDAAHDTAGTLAVTRVLVRQPVSAS